jgi:predicted lipoprotein with Yx(FWY)xxD motif
VTKLKLVAGVFFGMVSLLAAVAQDLPGGLRLGDTTKGKVLTDRRGMTLYVFDGDKGGTPSCYGTCAETWPPLKADQPAAASGNFTVVVRKDGTNQLSYKGRPLYTWHKDTAPGDINGDGFRDTWHIAKP